MTNPSQRFLLACLSASNFVIGMGAFVVVGFIPPLAADLQVTTASAGYVLTAYALSYAVLSPLLVALTGGIGRRRVMALGMLIFALSALASALSTSIEMLYSARFLAAAGAGMFTPVAAAVAAGLVAPEARGRALATVFFGLTLAQVIGVPIGSWLAFTFGWQLAFWVVFALALAATCLVWVVVPAGLRFQPVSLRDLRGVLGNLRVMMSVGFTASFLAAVYVVYTYLSPLLSQTMGYGRDGIALVLVLFGLGAVIGNLLGGWLTDRIGATKTLVLLCLGQILFMPVFSVLPIAPWMLLGLVMGWSVVGWSFMAPQQVRLLGLSADNAPVVLALNAAAIYIGAALGSALGGLVIDTGGLTMIGVAGGVAAFGALGHLLWSQRMIGSAR